MTCTCTLLALSKLTLFLLPNICAHFLSFNWRWRQGFLLHQSLQFSITITWQYDRINPSMPMLYHQPLVSILLPLHRLLHQTLSARPFPIQHVSLHSSILQLLSICQWKLDEEQSYPGGLSKLEFVHGVESQESGGL